MLRTWTLALGLTITVPAIAQEQRAALSMTGIEIAPSLTVRNAGSGNAALAAQSRLRLRFDFSASLDDGSVGYRILSSRIFLKAQGSDGGADVDAFAPGFRSGHANEDIEVSVDPLGPVAQSAKAACAAAGSDKQAAMLVPVVWRVTTGQFAFVRLAAGGLQPEEAMLSDPAYYADTASEDAEAAVPVTVTCEAAPPGKPNEQPVAKAKYPPPPVAKKIAEPLPQGEAAVQPATTIAVAAETIRCEGGIVRETFAGPGREVCLCPGNTSRRQLGDRAYVCEGRYVRRR